LPPTPSLAAVKVPSAGRLSLNGTAVQFTPSLSQPELTTFSFAVKDKLGGLSTIDTTAIGKNSNDTVSVGGAANQITLDDGSDTMHGGTGGYHHAPRQQGRAYSVWQQRSGVRGRHEHQHR
jgi:hypothetical protein